MTSPLITTDALDRIKACGLHGAFLAHEACPEFPLSLDKALSLMDEHREDAVFRGFENRSAVPAAARWLTATLLLQHGDWLTGDDLKRLHFPRLGIFVDEGRAHQSVLCPAETLTLLAPRAGSQVGLVMFPDAHAQIHSACEVIVAAEEVQLMRHGVRSVAARHPDCTVTLEHGSAEGVATWHVTTQAWWLNGEPLTPAPY